MTINISEVKTLYADITEVLDKSSFPPNQASLSHLQDRIDAVVNEVAYQGNFRWLAPSPWHATIFCVDTMARGASGTPLDEKRSHIKSLGEIDGMPAILLCFRGEGNASLLLCPNFHRLARGTIDYDHPTNKERRGKAQAMISCFVPLLKYATDECTRRTDGVLNWEKELFVAAAQHHQIPTEFMDWTTDPSVAVAFAATSRTTEDNAKHNAVVYILPMHRAVQLGGAFFLPPPYVERLYLQRGFFIRTDSLEADKELQDACLAIEFPRDAGFDVIRDSVPLVLMNKDAWIEEVKRWSENWIKANPGKFLDDETEVAVLVSKLKSCLEEIGIPSYLNSSNAVALGKLWRTRTFDMIERFTHLMTADGLKLNEYILRAVTCSNKRLMRGVAILLSQRRKALGSDKGRENQQLADAIFAALKTCTARNQIAERAYTIWQSSGSTHGHDVQDWLQAEDELAGAR